MKIFKMPVLKTCNVVCRKYIENVLDFALRNKDFPLEDSISSKYSSY